MELKYRVAYWIGSPMTRSNGTYRVTARPTSMGEAMKIRYEYFEMGYLAELIPVIS